VSPTVFRHRDYRFYFFSREEESMDVHVSSQEGEAKFWLEPAISLERNYGLPQQSVSEILKIIEAR